MAYLTPLWRKCLPFAFPQVVAVLGGLNFLPSPDWRVVTQQMQRLQEPSASVPVSEFRTNQLCVEDPVELAEELIEAGQRIGVKVLSGEPETADKDATYRALPGRLGTITLRPRPMSKEVRCLLISHEFIHVLQHLHGDLKGVEPLGWSVSAESVSRFGSLQEAEAYTHQNKVGRVLQRLFEAEVNH